MTEQESPPAPACAVDPTPEPSNFHTSMAHLYRAEMNRMTAWRTRLDATTHWAILLTTGMTTFTFGSPQIPHYILLLGLAVNAIFMFIEARRYQHLHHSKWRLALLEHNYFAGLLCPTHARREPTWREQLGSDLEQPHITIRLSMAARLRLRRNYVVLFFFSTATWLTKVFVHPDGPKSLDDFYQRLAVGELLPSWFVLVTACCFTVASAAIAWSAPSEEYLERWTKEHRAEMTRSRGKPPIRP